MSNGVLDEWNEILGVWHIERVPGAAVQIGSKADKPGEEHRRPTSPIQKVAVLAPGSQNSTSSVGTLKQMIFVVRPDGVCLPDHVLGVGGAKGKQIGHTKGAIAVLFGKADALADGRVILRFVTQGLTACGA